MKIQTTRPQRVRKRTPRPIYDSPVVQGTCGVQALLVMCKRHVFGCLDRVSEGGESVFPLLCSAIGESGLGVLTRGVVPSGTGGGEGLD